MFVAKLGYSYIIVVRMMALSATLELVGKQLINHFFLIQRWVSPGLLVLSVSVDVPLVRVSKLTHAGHCVGQKSSEFEFF